MSDEDQDKLNIRRFLLPDSTDAIEARVGIGESTRYVSGSGGSRNAARYTYAFAWVKIRQDDNTTYFDFRTDDEYDEDDVGNALVQPGAPNTKYKAFCEMVDDLIRVRDEYRLAAAEAKLLG